MLEINSPLEIEKQHIRFLYASAVIFCLVTVVIFYFSKENWVEQRSLLDLYYFPVLIAAVSLGWRWGLFYGMSATFLSIILRFVIPRAMGEQSELINAVFINRTILLNFIALGCGYLADRERSASAQLRELATLDSLTNLYNHREFVRRLNEEIARAKRYKHSFCLLIVDLDDFKLINDAHGHQAGNQVLKKIAEIIRNSVQNVDCVARYGGDEIAIIGRVNDIQGSQILAERLRMTIEKTEISLSSGKVVQFTVSIGVSNYPHDYDTMESMISAADKALHTAKMLGQNYAMLFSNLGAVAQPTKQ